MRASASDNARQHDRREHDQQQIVLRHRLAEDRDRAGKSRRTRPQQILGAPDGQRRILDQQHDAEGRDQLQQFGRTVEAPQQQFARSARRATPTASAASSTPPQ